MKTSTACSLVSCAIGVMMLIVYFFGYFGPVSGVEIFSIVSVVAIIFIVISGRYLETKEKKEPKVVAPDFYVFKHVSEHTTTFSLATKDGKMINPFMLFLCGMWKGSLEEIARAISSLCDTPEYENSLEMSFSFPGVCEFKYKGEKEGDLKPYLCFPLTDDEKREFFSYFNKFRAAAEEKRAEKKK